MGFAKSLRCRYTTTCSTMIACRTLFFLLLLTGWSTSPLSAQCTLQPNNADVPTQFLPATLRPGMYPLGLAYLSIYRFRQTNLINDNTYRIPGTIKQFWFTDLTTRDSEKLTADPATELPDPDPAVSSDALGYRQFAAGLIKASLEQQKDIEQLQQDVRIVQQRYNQLHTDYQDLETKLEALQTIVDELLAKEKRPEAITALHLTPILQQNDPNPFRRETNIEYFVPPGYQTASIHLSTVEGKVVRRIELTQSGRSTLHLKRGTFPPGTYQYSLIIDGTLIDTKRMVIVK